MDAISITEFELISQIGRGTYAKVILARFKPDSKLYALKILNKKHIIAKGQEQQILTEKKILNKIQHPFLIGLHSTFQTPKKLYFVLDYCPGGQLFNLLLLKDRLTDDQTKFYAAQIILALEELHNQNVIYRDLKPQNVIIDKYGYLKLTDFGLAKILDSQNSVAMSFCGTPEYLAPQIIKKIGYGTDVDWWCLGCLIHEMLTGHPPFKNQNRMQLLEAIICKPPDLTKVLHCQFKLTPLVQDLLKKLLHKDPKKRLGHNGVAQIKSHGWFERINWQAVESKKIKPPFIPKLSNETDTTNFDSEFTKATVESYDEYYDDQEAEESEKFKDFSYNFSAQN